MRRTRSLSHKRALLLDVGCGAMKWGPLWTGMDVRALPGVDIVHDLERFPWPLPSNSVSTARMSHVLEHIKPWLTIQLFDELWRVLKPEAIIHIACPYGVSSRFVQDPTHCNPVSEVTFYYFDPQPPGWPIPQDNPEAVNGLYEVYRPRPWKIEQLYWQQAGDIEVLLKKREDKWSYASMGLSSTAPSPSRRRTPNTKR